MLKSVRTCNGSNLRAEHGNTVKTKNINERNDQKHI